MSKLAIIKINQGDFDRGFSAAVRIEENGGCIYDKTHSLPPAPHLPELYQSWKSGYSDRPLRGSSTGDGQRNRQDACSTGDGQTNSQDACSTGNFRALEAIDATPTNISVREMADELETSFNGWLNSLDRGVQDFREGLLDNLSKTEDVRFVVETKDETLERLPWERWDFLERYENSDVVLSFPDRLQTRPPIKLKEKVKILVILGESSDIEVQADLKLLQEQLPQDAQILEPLIATNREKVDRALWDEKFDILFFAGHSSTDFGNGTGKFYINDGESLTVADLKEGLKRAIANGLKLAIFNSCDGIGLGRDLADLQMPAIVVMREKIPDEAAQRFLELFLKAFAIDGKTLSAAVTEARKRLKGLESRYPCASWLPVLCHHPEAEMLTWESLRVVKEKQQRRQLSLIQGLQVVLLASFIGTGIVSVTREFGWWQRWELKAYNLLMQQRLLKEEPDKRLLLIAVDSNDVGSQSKDERGAASLSDKHLQQLLARLKPHQPRVLGNSIYRENPVGETNPELANLMQSDRLFGICQYDSGDRRGISAPPEILASRQGFSNVLRDFDGIIRRHLLAVESPEPCQNKFAFSSQLAIRYLADEGVAPTKTPEGNIQLGDVVFKTLEKNAGGYRNIDARGHQVMLNYRHSREIADTLTLTEVLNGDFDPELVRDRIVLIGTTDPSFNNHRWLTPYSSGEWPIREFTGIEVQAQMVSQILSAVLDNRPLIWWWSDLGENLWIWCWSLAGGILARYLSSRLWLPIVGVGLLGVLYASCLLLMTAGVWAPLLPSAFALAASGGIAVFWVNVLDKKQQ